MNIPPPLSYDLALAAQFYFQSELSRNFSTLKGEVDYIDRLHRKIHQLEYWWNYVLEVYLGNRKPTFSMQSYFIHKTPQVTFGGISKKSVEFGDLLYVYNETQVNTTQLRQNAVLLQAKMRHNPKLDQDQLSLYSHWPDFSFTNGSMSGRNYKIDTQPNSHLGARYLYLEKTIPMFRPFKWGMTANPRLGLHPHHCDYHFVWELIGLMDFSRGKELNGDWGDAIKEVINWVVHNNIPYTHRSQANNRGASMLSMLSSNGTGTRVQPFETEEPDKGFWLVVVNAENVINDEESM